MPVNSPSSPRRQRLLVGLAGVVGAAWILFWLLVSFIAAAYFGAEECDFDRCERTAVRGAVALVVIQLGLLLGALVAGVAQRLRILGGLAVVSPLAMFFGLFLIAALANASDSDPSTEVQPAITAPVPSPSSGIELADDVASTDEDSILRVPAPGVLANDSDLDGDDLTVNGHHEFSAAGARVVVFEDGAWTYDPTAAQRLQALDDGVVFDDMFRYRASDGATDRWAAVEVAVTGRSDP